jgi:TRAP-type mannitol/chloroaromatic compound transport system permease small subunit
LDRRHRPAGKVFGVPSNIPQYLEWELFLLLVFLTLGYGYVRGAHVRVDIIRDRLRPVIRDRIELVGLLLLIVPFVLVIFYFGIPYAVESYHSGEKSALALGAPARWLLKGAMPFGLGLLLLAAVVAALRNLSQRWSKD